MPVRALSAILLFCGCAHEPAPRPKTPKPAPPVSSVSPTIAEPAQPSSDPPSFDDRAIRQMCRNTPSNRDAWLANECDALDEQAITANCGENDPRGRLRELEQLSSERRAVFLESSTWARAHCIWQNDPTYERELVRVGDIYLSRERFAGFVTSIPLCPADATDDQARAAAIIARQLEEPRAVYEPLTREERNEESRLRLELHRCLSPNSER